MEKYVLDIVGEFQNIDSDNEDAGGIATDAPQRGNPRQTNLDWSNAFFYRHLRNATRGTRRGMDPKLTGILTQQLGRPSVRHP